jgi:hypothetical protein
MRCSTKGLCLAAAVLVAGSLAAGCGSTAQSAISNVPSKVASATAAPSVTGTASAGVTKTASAGVTRTATTTVTATARPSPPVTTPAATTVSTAAAKGASSGTNLLWLWILLGVAVLLGLIAWIVHSARRRSAAATADWRSRLIDAYAQGSALHDAMSVAEVPGQFADGNAAARWADIQRRADDLTQSLYSLREAVPDDDNRARIENALASLQAVRSAMDAERTPGGAGPRQAEVVRNRLYSFEMSLRALREADQQYH